MRLNQEGYRDESLEQTSGQGAGPPVLCAHRAWKPPGNSTGGSRSATQVGWVEQEVLNWIQDRA